jgi:hypothetical protein
MLITLATPEDVLLAKLEWAKLGDSDRQIEDAAGILKMQRDSLDSGIWRSGWPNSRFKSSGGLRSNRRVDFAPSPSPSPSHPQQHHFRRDAETHREDARSHSRRDEQLPAVFVNGSDGVAGAVL